MLYCVIWPLLSKGLRQPKLVALDSATGGSGIEKPDIPIFQTRVMLLETCLQDPTHSFSWNLIIIIRHVEVVKAVDSQDT